MWVDDIMEKVTTCISDLDFDSNLPLLICNKCLGKMEDFFEFRNQCLQSEFFINGYIDKLLNDGKICKTFISTVLNVNVVKDFSSSNKYQGNVRLRKSLKGTAEVSGNLLNGNLVGSLPTAPVTVSKKVKRPISEEKRHRHVAKAKPINSTVIDQSDFTQPVVKKIVSHAPCSTNHKSNSVVVSTNVEVDDDIFVEEEDEYSVQDEAAAGKSLATSHAKDIMQDLIREANVDIFKDDSLDLHDPENLLIDNGQERSPFDIQTDVSERVKLRRRNARSKPVYQEMDSTKREHARKSTTCHKKSQARKSTSKGIKPVQNYVDDAKDNVEKNSQVTKANARKSTSKHWINLKKNKTKKTPTSGNLWKAACRNWALQRMQTSGHVNTGSRPRIAEFDSFHAATADDDSGNSNIDHTITQDILSLSNSIKINKGYSSTNLDTQNKSIATTVICQDLPGFSSLEDDFSVDFDTEDLPPLVNETLSKSIRAPRVKTVKELNALLEQQQHHFNKNLSNEYGIVVDDESYSEIVEPAEEIQDDKLTTKDFQPTILNTYSLNDEDSWNPNRDCPEEKIVMKTRGVFTFPIFPITSDLSSLETNVDFILDGNALPHGNINKQPEMKVCKTPKSGDTAITVNCVDDVQSLQHFNSEQSHNSEEILPPVANSPNKVNSSTTDFDRAITAHVVGSGVAESTKITEPKNPKTYARHKTNTTKATQYNIKGKDLILIDSGKIPLKVSAKEEKLYKSNFGNLLEHYLSNAPDSTANKNVSYRLSPVKIVVPPKPVFKTYPGKDTRKLQCSVSIPTNNLSFIPNVKHNLSKIKTTAKLVKIPERNFSALPSDRLTSTAQANRWPSSTTTSHTLPKEIRSATLGTQVIDSDVILIDDSPPPSVSQEEIDPNVDNSEITSNDLEIHDRPSEEKINREKRGTKRHSSCDDEPSSAKSLRASSEESDSLVIDDSPRWHTEEQADVLGGTVDKLAFTCTPDNRIHNTGQARDEGDNILLEIKEEFLFLDSDVQNCANAIDSDRLSSCKSEKSSVAQHTYSTSSKSTNKIGSIELDAVPAIKIKEESNFEVNSASRNVGSSKIMATSNKFPENGTSNEMYRHFGSSKHVKPKSVTSNNRIPDLFDAASMVGLNSACQVSSTSSQINNSVDDGCDTFSDSDTVDKSSDNLDKLINGLESPPRSRSRRTRRLSKHSLTLSNNTNTSQYKEEEPVLTICDTHSNIPRRLLSPNSEDFSGTIHALMPTDTSGILGDNLENSKGASISSDSDSSYVDVEAVSDGETSRASSLCVQLFASHRKNVKERSRCRQIRENLNTLHHVIDDSFSEGKNIFAVLQSAKKYIHSLRLQSDKLDNEYHYLKAKHDYLLQTITQLKKI